MYYITIFVLYFVLICNNYEMVFYYIIFFVCYKPRLSRHGQWAAGGGAGAGRRESEKFREKEQPK